jgi:hypothetical protein
MTDKIREQIKAVQKSGYCNMLDSTAVQRYAFDHERWDLVCYIEDDRRRYGRFVMTGSEEVKK